MPFRSPTILLELLTPCSKKVQARALASRLPVLIQKALTDLPRVPLAVAADQHLEHGIAGGVEALHGA